MQAGTLQQTCGARQCPGTPLRFLPMLCIAHLRLQVVEGSHGVRGGASASRRSAALGLPALLQGYQVFLAGAWQLQAFVFLAWCQVEKCMVPFYESIYHSNGTIMKKIVCTYVVGCEVLCP